MDKLPACFCSSYPVQRVSQK